MQNLQAKYPNSRMRGSWQTHLTKALLAIAFICLHSALVQPATQEQEAVRQITDAIRSGEYSKAVELADGALHDQPKDARLWTLKGIACEKAGDLVESMKYFETAVQLSPNYVPALAGAAETNYQAGNDRASFFLERLLKLQPDDSTTHAMLAGMAYKKRDCKKAVVHFGLA